MILAKSVHAVHLRGSDSLQRGDIVSLQECSNNAWTILSHKVHKRWGILYFNPICKYAINCSFPNCANATVPLQWSLYVSKNIEIGFVSTLTYKHVGMKSDLCRKISWKRISNILRLQLLNEWVLSQTFISCLYLIALFCKKRIGSISSSL